MDAPLEISNRVREYLPEFAVEEAVQARARGDAICPLCKQAVPPSSDASLLVTTVGPQYRLALMHRSCGASQIVQLDPQGRKLLPDTFALRWRATVRDTRPRAIFIWENQTNFDSWSEDDYGSEIPALRIFGFVTVEGGLDAITAPQASYVNAVHRRGALELRLGDTEDQVFPGQQPRAWCSAAEQEGKVLLVHGTDLRLAESGSEGLRDRIDAGRVVAAVVPFRSTGTLPSAGASIGRQHGRPRRGAH